MFSTKIFKLWFFTLLVLILSLPVAISLLQIVATDKNLSPSMNWAALHIPKFFSQLDFEHYVVLGIFVIICSQLAFITTFYKLFATSIMIVAVTFSQSIFTLMPARFLPVEICERCAMLDTSVQDPSLSLAFATTGFVTTMWVFFVGLPVGAITAAVHLFIIKVTKPLEDPA